MKSLFKKIREVDYWGFFFPNQCLYCSTLTNQRNRFCSHCQDKIESTPQEGFETYLDEICEIFLESNDKSYLSYSMIDYCPRGQVLVKVFKYDGFYRLLNSIFSQEFKEKFQFSLKLNFDENDLLVPIPLHFSKLRERGFNQALVFAEYLVDNFGGEVAEILLRDKNNKAQARQDIKQRQKNSQELFSFKELLKMDLANRKVWIVDDVLTTGSTVQSAIKVLESSGVNVKGVITLARSGYKFSIQEDWELEKT